VLAAREARDRWRPPGRRHGPEPEPSGGEPRVSRHAAAGGRRASEPTPPAPGRRGTGDPPGRPPRFGALLLLLVTTYVLSAFASGDWVGGIQIVLFLGVAALAIRNGRIARRVARQALILTIGGSAIAVTLALTHSSEAAKGAAKLWAGLMLLFAVIVIVRRVLAQPTVTLQSIFGAISAYLIIGLMFASFFSAVWKFSGTAFFASGETENVQTFQYFSFTTLTTLGYGDYTAVNSGGQALAVMEALIGQIFLATLVARLVAAFRGPASRRADGPDPPADRSPAARPPRRRKQPPVRPALTRSAVRRTSSRDREPPARRSRSRPGR
jgi:ion channel